MKRKWAIIGIIAFIVIIVQVILLCAISAHTYKIHVNQEKMIGILEGWNVRIITE